MYPNVYLLVLVCLQVQPLWSTSSPHQTHFNRLAWTNFIVDKTLLIKDLFEQDVRYHIITCPSGFGKSTNLEMIKRFVQVPLSRDHRVITNKTDTPHFKLFTDPQKNFRIARETQLFNRHFGDYLTIFLNFDIGEAKNYTEIMQQISLKIRATFENYRWFYKYVLDKNAGIVYHKAKLLFERIDLNEATEEDFVISIQTLAEAISTYYDRRRVFLFIDNYDTPILRAFRYSAQSRKVHEFIKRMILAVVNSSPAYVRRAVFYGVSGMLATGMATVDFAPINTLLGYSRFLDDHPLNTYCGFTDDEVEILFDRHHVTREEAQTLTKYYDGYRSERASPRIYNPSSLIAYLEEKSRQNGKAVINKYWSRNQSALVLPQRLKHLYLRDLYDELILFNKVLTCWPQPMMFDPDKEFTEMENMLDPNSDGMTFYPIIYIGHLYELGYLSYYDHCGRLQIPNTETQIVLERDLHKFYTEVVGIHQTKLKRIANIFVQLVDNSTTTRDMLEELHASLSEPDIVNYFYDRPHAKHLRKGKRMDLNAFLYIASTIHGWSQLGAIKSKYNVSMLIDGKLNDTFERVTKLDLYLACKTRKNALFVQIGFENNIKRLIEHATQLVPRTNRKPPQYLKHIAINLKNKKFEIATAPTRQCVNGEWQNI